MTGIKTKFIWENGKFINWDESLLHSVNFSLHYGTAVFEGIRVYKTSNGEKIFRLTDHVKRLFYSAKVIGVKNLDYSVEEIVQIIKELVQKNGVSEGYIRPIIFFDGSKMGLNPQNNGVIFSISVWPWGSYLQKDGIEVYIPKVRRIDYRTCDVKAKVSGYYSNSVFAVNEVKKIGADEGLLLDTNGFIAEGPGENIFFITKNSLITPAEGNILPGITRDTIKKIAGDLGFQVKEKKIKPKQLKKFDEAFFVGTAAEVTPIKKIFDGKNTWNFKVQKSREILDYYSQIVHGKIKKYSNWCE